MKEYLFRGGAWDGMTREADGRVIELRRWTMHHNTTGYDKDIYSGEYPSIVHIQHIDSYVLQPSGVYAYQPDRLGDIPIPAPWPGPEIGSNIY